MFKKIPGYSNYAIDINGVVINVRTKKQRKPTSIGTVSIIDDYGVLKNHTVNSLMKLAGFKQIWIDPEINDGNQIQA